MWEEINEVLQIVAQNLEFWWTHTSPFVFTTTVVLTDRLDKLLLKTANAKVTEKVKLLGFGE